MLLALLLVAATSAHAAEMSAPDFAPKIQGFEREVKAQLRKHKLAGLSLALVSGNQVVWSEGFGWADAKEKVPARADTRYQLGGLTQLFTTLSVLQLAERGRLSLDDPITKHLTDLTFSGPYANRADEVTVRALLTHHGGVQGTRLEGLFLDQPPAGVRATKNVFMPQQPNQIYSYSNEGFELLGQVIERVAGVPYDQHLSETLLRPMGLTGEYFAGTGLASAHNKLKRDPIPYPQYQAAMGMQGSVLDLVKVMQLFLNRGEVDGEPVLSPASLSEMNRHQNGAVRLDLDNAVGLGWQLTDLSEHRADVVLRSQSASLRYGALLLIAPSERIGLALLSNSNDSSEALLDLGRDLLDEALYQVTGNAPPDRSKRIRQGKPLPAAAEDAPMAPDYATAAGLISFKGEPDHYRMRFLGRVFHATRRDDGWYDVRYRLLGIINLSFGLLKEILLRPVTIDATEGLLVQFRGQVFLLGATFEKRGVTQKWLDLAGDYELENPDVLSEQLQLESIRFEFEDDTLLFSYRLPFFLDLHVRLPVQPVNESTLIIPGLGTNMGEPVQLLNTANGPVFEYSGYRFAVRP